MSAILSKVSNCHTGKRQAMRTEGQFQRHLKAWASFLSLLHVGVLSVFSKVPFHGSALDFLPTSRVGISV
jgi:hypothetical protein